MKKALVFGLGLLGGGIATTNWLLKKGYEVTVTDMKSEKDLASSIEKIEGRVSLRLGGHNKKDIGESDLIVFNPGVSVYSEYVQYAKELGKEIENEATLFYKNCDKPIIAITGTRGKTTTADWATYFIDESIRAGNSTDEPLLKMIDKEGSVVVNEIPSFHLELFNQKMKAPDVAVITNIYRDHLNRYPSFEAYAETKGYLFNNQTKDQQLILNYDNEWTNFFLDNKPKSKIWFTSIKKLERELSGVFFEDNSIFFQVDGEVKKVLNINKFLETWGEHNVYNLLASSLASYLSGTSWENVQNKVESVPQIEFRQEVIFDDGELKIINDTAATSPEGGIVAINRFASDDCYLITGGTDKDLDFSEWPKVVKQNIKKENLILFEGSATDKMIKELGYNLKTYSNLEDCLKAALDKSDRKGVILFSSASKSFEKFTNEFDRGKQFNLLVQKEVGGERKG